MVAAREKEHLLVEWWCSTVPWLLAQWRYTVDMRKRWKESEHGNLLSGSISLFLDQFQGLGRYTNLWYFLWFSGYESCEKCYLFVVMAHPSSAKKPVYIIVGICYQVCEQMAVKHLYVFSLC